MHAIHIVLVVVHAIVLAGAADTETTDTKDPDTVKWTLHKSCYRALDDKRTVPVGYLSPNEYVGDDDKLADAMIKSVQTVKAWAARGAEKIDDSIRPIPFLGWATKEALKPLIGRGTYKDNAKDISDKFTKLAKLEGPIGQDVPVDKDGKQGGRYDQSEAWKSLQKSDEHYLNFLIVCRPEIALRRDAFDPRDTPFDMIRQNKLFNGADLETLTLQEIDPGKWDDVKKRIQAVTTRGPKPDENGHRPDVPETITFHPLWIQHHRDRGFEGWTQKMFDQATAADVAKVMKDKSEKNKMDLRPVDLLLDTSLTKNMFHEMFHLTAFGRMVDDSKGAYLWANNIRLQNRKNPDLFAIIAVVIELLNREDGQYKISAEGEVSKR